MLLAELNSCSVAQRSPRRKLKWVRSYLLCVIISVSKKKNQAVSNIKATVG